MSGYAIDERNIGVIHRLFEGWAFLGTAKRVST